jgi:uncharacterized protein YacL
MLGFLKKEKNIKILDTSILIDGRIVKILKTGFLDGSFVIPNFVIGELHSLSDSHVDQKRSKGRRGLEVLESLQKIIPIEIVSDYDASIEKVLDVDGKLIILCDLMGAKLLTVDYTLNKVAKIKGVIVLNINDLFQAVRPPILVGDVISIRIVRRGKEENQGVGTLDDGTMVVVDEAQQFIGQKIKIEVRQVIENPAGRLVFAEIITI